MSTVLLACAGGGGNEPVSLTLDQEGRVGPFGVTFGRCQRVNNEVWVTIEVENKSNERQAYGPQLLEVETPSGRIAPAESSFGDVLWTPAELQPSARSTTGVVQFPYNEVGGYRFRITTNDGTGEVNCQP